MKAQAGTSSSHRDIQQAIRQAGWFSGPVLFLAVLFFLHPSNMPPSAVKVMAVTLWIAIWWVTEAIPLPVTSLLPIVLFPLMKVMKLEETTAAYGHPLVFLYIGGFLLAIAIEKTGLHTRIALSIIHRMGTRLNMIVLGFMLSTGFLSMWISNTATAVMMLPIGLAIITVSEHNPGHAHVHFSKSLMLAIAYAASIGGVATLIGTPPNVVFAGVVRDTLKVEVSFLQWFMIGFPLAAVLLVVAWWYITRIGFPLYGERLSAKTEQAALHFGSPGSMSSTEKKVAIVFAVMAVSWITRSFFLEKIIPGMDDTIIAMIGGLALFLIPADRKKWKGILIWEDAVKLPWGIILLFGGGLALAGAFETSGLATWIGNSLTGLTLLGKLFIILLVVAIVNFLTEFTSNLATVTMILPVLVPIAVSAGIPPLYLMTGATLAASCGFMMPAGTPPNAIAFGSGYLKIWDMVRTGFVLNVVSIGLITLITYFILGYVWQE